MPSNIASKSTSLVPAFVALIIGLAAGYLLAPDAKRIVEEIPVPIEVAEKGEPTAKQGIGDKLSRVPVQSTTRRVASGGAFDDVATFCGAVDSAQRDTADGRPVPQIVPSEPIPIGAIPRAQTYDGEDLETWLARYNGDLVRVFHEEVYAPLEWYVSGDSLVVRSARFHWLDDAAVGTICAGSGVIAGETIGLTWSALLVTLTACGGAWTAF